QHYKLEKPERTGRGTKKHGGGREDADAEGNMGNQLGGGFGVPEQKELDPKSGDTEPHKSENELAQR
ncbi:MAG: hypothetical protein ACJ799_12155, partial [Gemmatimonadaceae bacterium]